MKYKNLIIILFVFFLFGACSPKEKTPPIIPSVESLNFDFSYFEQSKAEGLYYSYAGERVSTWEALIKDSINIHNTALKESSYNDFSFQKDETWLMEYAFNIEDISYYAKFFGIIEIDTVRFRTFLSFNIDTMLFLDGKFFNDSKTGQWFLNNPGFNEDTVYTGIKFMTVNWSLDSLDQKEIKFTNNQSGENNLNYLLYKDSVDLQYTKYIDIYSKQDDSHSIIEWDILTRQGRIKDLNHFGNENWHCWDENYSDTDCN